ncbi:MAG: type II toxin-antitoxin system VapC family toxin [bacterium]|nr:type II toxin-antitoxin system VapC family toxin [bacterium]
MTTNPLKIVVDADAIIAQAYPGDAHHVRSMDIAKDLVRLNAHVIYPVTAIVEATTFIQRVLNSPAMAIETAGLFVDAAVPVETIDKELFASALQSMHPRMSKKHTLFDCIVLAVAKRHNADAIFSFDGFYPKQGFPLISEFLKMR